MWDLSDNRAIQETTKIRCDDLRENKIQNKGKNHILHDKKACKQDG